jgi:hypothetical protein
MFASYVFGLLSIYTIVRLRLYFTVVARYINEQRYFFLRDKPLNFENNSGMYVNYKYPQPYDGLSSHMISMYLIVGLNSIAVWVIASFITLWLSIGGAYIFIIPTICYFISLFGIVLLANSFLKGKNDLSADMAVFGKNVIEK